VAIAVLVPLMSCPDDGADASLVPCLARRCACAIDLPPNGKPSPAAARKEETCHSKTSSRRRSTLALLCASSLVGTTALVGCGGGGSSASGSEVAPSTAADPGKTAQGAPVNATPLLTERQTTIPRDRQPQSETG
jgi:hypothetical protein